MARTLQDSTRSKRVRAADKAPPAPGRLARLRQHRLWRDIAMIPVVCLVLFLLASLLTYSSADPGWSQSGGVTTSLHNWGGRIGAWLADVLFYLTGYVAYLLPVVLGIVAWIALFGMDGDGDGVRRSRNDTHISS